MEHSPLSRSLECDRDIINLFDSIGWTKLLAIMKQRKEMILWEQLDGPALYRAQGESKTYGEFLLFEETYRRQYEEERKE